jgi:hypothetical protein
MFGGVHASQVYRALELTGAFVGLPLPRIEV